MVTLHSIARSTWRGHELTSDDGYLPREESTSMRIADVTGYLC
jgi:hypothetical protein